MSWLKVDDRFSDHPKVLAALERRGGVGAIGLWVLAGSWSAGQGTNGRVPRAIVRRYGTKGQADTLVDAGLWEVCEGGYQFHDWEDYQPDSEAQKAAARERARKWREKQRTETRDVQKDHAHVPDGTGGVGSGSGIPRHEILANQFAHELNNSRPDGTKAFAGSDIRRIAACIEGREVSHVRAVVAFVRDQISRGKLPVAEWSKLWAKDGVIFGIREQELAERNAPKREVRPPEWKDNDATDRSEPVTPDTIEAIASRLSFAKKINPEERA